MLLRRLYWTAWLALHSRGQARYPFRPLAAIRRDQARRVRRIVAHASRHVPYYREAMARLGLTASDFRDAGDLAKLPIIEREELRRDPDYFASDAPSFGGRLCLHTSGSSGITVAVQRDGRGLFQLAACAERVRSIVASLVGRRTGYRETTIFNPQSATVQLRDFLRENTVLPRGVPVVRQSLSATEPPQILVEQISAFRPDVIATYGSSLESLFAHLHASGQPFHRPKVVIYGADALSDTIRRLITEEFGIHVLSGYLAVEALAIAFECEQHRGMHLNIDLNPVRIVDAKGRTLPPGEPGEVVVSSLVNHATVLLNYRLGDVAALLPDPCPCGRSLPLLSFPQGRSDDLMELPSGRVVHTAIANVFNVEPDIWQFQVVQQTPTHFRMSLVVAHTCDREQLQRRVSTKLADILGEEGTMEIEFVDAIARTAGGKHLALIPFDLARRSSDPRPGDGAPDS